MIVAIFVLIGNIVFAQQHKLGGDKDSHGCKASAGYTWSIVKKECIRTFELPVKLDEVNLTGSSTSFAGVAFSKDMKKAEIFLASEKSSVILVKSGKVWKKGNYSLTKTTANTYSLMKGKKVIFKN